MRRALVGLGVFLVVAAAVFVLVVRADEPSAVEGLRAVGDQPFGDGDVLPAGATGAVLSGDGTRLAVLSDDGLGVAEDGRVRPVTDRGSKVVDVAWFGNGATLLVAEGPVPTGALVVVDLDGTVRGSVPLSPSVGFGTGHGMAVAPGGRRAVVTAVERPALGPEQRHLVLVDLETGTTEALTTPGGPDESGPHYVDARRVAFTETPADGGPVRALLLDLHGGRVTEVAGGATVAGVAGDEVVVLAGRELRRGAAGARLGEIPEGTALAGVDAAGGQAVVVDRRGRLQRIEIDKRSIPR